MDPMKHRPHPLALLALLAAGLACLCSTSNTIPPLTSEPPEPATRAPLASIGSVTQLQGGVEAGPESALEVVSPDRDIYDQDAVHVFDSGVAALDFGHGLAFTLYNESSTTGTSVATNGQVRAKLSQGGLQGYTPPGGRMEVEVPNGLVVVLGTRYVILYDPATDITRVINYDGTVQYSVRGGSLESLPSKAMVEFDGNKVLRLYENLDLSPDQFNQYSTESASPFKGLDRIQAEYKVPGPPELVAPPDGSVSGSMPGLQWDPVENASGFRLQMAADSSFSGPLLDITTAAAEWLPDKPFPEGTYYWHLQPLNIFGYPSAWGPTWTFSFRGKPEAPLLTYPPDGGELQTDIPKFSWEPARGAARYTLQLSSAKDFSYVDFESQTEGTSWAAPYPLKEGEYFWRVQSFNDLSLAGDWSKTYAFKLVPASASFVPVQPLLPGPSITDPAYDAQLDADALKFSWKPVDGAASYYLQLSTARDFSHLDLDGPTGGTSWAPDYPPKPGEYYWRVQAIDYSYIPGTWSETFRFRALPPLTAPVLAYPRDGQPLTPDKLYLAWKPVDGANQYYVQIGSDDGFKYLDLDAYARGTSWSPPQVLKTGGYYWRVQALNAAGRYGPWSSTGKVVVSVPPGIPTLYKPVNGAVGESVQPTFTWSAPQGAVSYTIQVAKDRGFTLIFLYASPTQTQWTSRQLLGYSSGYFWRVHANNIYGTPGEWSATYSFKTK
jgi:hypothetical protein